MEPGVFIKVFFISMAGGLGGVLSGLFSTGGPPIVLYLMNSLTDNITYFASTQFYFFGTGMYST